MFFFFAKKDFIQFVTTDKNTIIPISHVLML